MTTLRRLRCVGYVGCALTIALAGGCGHDAAPPPNGPGTPTTVPAPPEPPVAADATCLAGVWTQVALPSERPVPGACGGCPPTTYELSDPDEVGFQVSEGGVVHRRGRASQADGSLVFELVSAQDEVEARFACTTEVECHRLRCDWDLGGAGENLLTKP